MPERITTARLDAVLRVARASRNGTPLPPNQKPRFGQVHKDLAALRWNESVLGYAIAEKRTDGQHTGETCLRVYVRKKAHKRRLKGEQPIPPVFAASREEWSIPTDVVEMPLLPRAQKSLAPGDSLGHFSGTSGSIGVRVTGSTGKIFILTCAHVAAPPGAGFGDPIESPADSDRAPGPNVIGKLFSFTDLSEDVAHEADAALVEVSSGNDLSNDRLRLSAPPRFSSLSPANFGSFRNRVVERFSRRVVSGQPTVTTQIGVVQSVGNDLLFDMGFGVARFTGVIEAAYTNPTEAGDSGSPVIDASARDILGIHFAGNGTQGFFITGTKIAELLQVRIA